MGSEGNEMVAWLKDFYHCLSLQFTLRFEQRDSRPCSFPSDKMSLKNILPGCCFGLSGCGLWETHEYAVIRRDVRQNHRAFESG